MDLTYCSELGERFLESHVAAGGSAKVRFLNYWPQNTKSFILKYLATANSERDFLPRSIKFGTEILDVLFKRWSQDKKKYFLVDFFSQLPEKHLTEYCLHLLAGIKESDSDNFVLLKDRDGAYILSFPRCAI
uniref:Uncharacterized protein n=1 Tax=Steinernema glaseri TaxID=37863 RepID=A0A1I7ZC02_9BILA